MNPTFSLSAAEALTLPASKTAAVAARSVLLIIHLHSGYYLKSGTRRPHEPLSETEKSTVWHKNCPERRRRCRASGPRPRDQNKHDDGREIRQRRHELRGDTEAERLHVQLQDGHGAKQVGADGKPSRPPGGEHDQRQRDPAAARRHARNEERR